MTLEKLIEGVETAATAGPLAVEIAGVCYDSREARPGSVFAALPGEHVDGHNFIPGAVAAGTVAILSERPPIPGFSATWVQVQNIRRAVAQAAAAFYGHPSRQLKVVGITGTNGKTTTSFLLESILQAAGERTGLFGTVEYHTATAVIPARQTTPEAVDLQRFFAELRAGGASWAVMEVSSHALALDRVYGCHFEAAVFTNLARDHLDFHLTFESYFEAKKRLFLGVGAPPPRLAVLNLEDPRGRELAEVGLSRVVGYSLVEDGGTVSARKPQLTADGIRFTLVTPDGSIGVQSPLVGRSNLSDLLTAAATAWGLGLPLETIAAGLGALERVPGRFERVDLGQPFTVVVDFAHTDLAFTNLLLTARELARGRVIIVFGSGGDRDRTKRPIMGEIAGRLADVVLLTTDNPRSEDPVRIINDISVGLQQARGNYVIEVDREQAIARAFDLAHEGDIVLLAGKGHQDTQIFRDRTEPWSDTEVARRLLVQRGYAGREAARSNAG
jgi:UDP-N-acetylmuramoyl-L-alanyl-D-glutamate--2,6-diaminopimelate ligase